MLQLQCPLCRKTLRLVAGQLETGALLCRACREAQKGAERQRLEQARAKAAIAQLLERDDVLILDTETTGLKDAEVVELAVINTRGELLLDTLVRPRRTAMNPYAERLHGISVAMLRDAPSWPEVHPRLCELAERRTLLAWNAPFDASMLRQTSETWQLEHPRWLFVCAMRLYARGRGLRARGLHKAVLDESLTHLLARHPSHRALGDVHFVLEVLRASARAAAEAAPGP